METIYRKVSVKKRLPEGEGFMRLLVCDSGELDVWEDYDPNNEDDKMGLFGNYTHWLEEMKLSNDEEIENLFTKQGIVNDYVKGKIKGAKVIRDLIIENEISAVAVTPNEVQK